MRVDVSMVFMKICGSGVRRKRDPGQEKGGKPLKKPPETKRKRKRKLRLVMKGRDPEKSQKVRTKAELLQLNRTQFLSLGIFVSKKVGNRKN